MNMGKIFKSKLKNHFAESSELISLTSNPGAGAFERKFLSQRVSVPSQSWYTGLCGNGYSPSLPASFRGRQLMVSKPKVSLS
jgi:hypothetical protein